MQVITYMCDYPHCPKQATMHIEATGLPPLTTRKSFDTCDDHAAAQLSAGK